MRYLDGLEMPYEVLTYPATVVTAVGVAGILGVPPGEVLKTLVVLADGKPALVMVSGDTEVDLKVLARAVGAKAVQMAPKARAESLTGLQTGGIGALALTGKRFPVYVDERALEHDRVLVNGGKRGLNLRLKSADLVQATGARSVRVTQ